MENRFKQRRKEVGLTAEQAAVKLGVSLGTLYSWERGDTQPRADTLARMVHVYGVTSDWLLGIDAE